MLAETMNKPPPSGLSEAAKAPDSGDLEATALRIRAAALQQRSRNAASEDQLAGWPPQLEGVRLHERLVEPTFDSGSGPVGWLQRALYHLFSKRSHRALLAQQNEFNRQAGLALRELWQVNRDLEQDLADLEAQLEKRPSQTSDTAAT